MSVFRVHHRTGRHTSISMPLSVAVILYSLWYWAVIAVVSCVLGPLAPRFAPVRHQSSKFAAGQTSLVGPNARLR